MSKDPFNRKHLTWSLVLATCGWVQSATPYRLWYAAPATSWQDQCLPIGNGRIGGMIYGGVATDQIQFNEITLWKGGTTSGGTGNYMGFGDLFFDVSVPGAIYTNYQRELDIGEAVSHVSYTAGGKSFRREYFSSFPDSVMVGHFTCSAAGQLSLLVRMSPLVDLTSKTVSASGNVITLSGYEGSAADLANMNFEAQVYVKNYGGTQVVEGANIRVTNADSVDVIFAATTDFNASNAGGWRSGALPHARVAAQIKNAAAKTYPALLAAHVADYQNLFNRFTLGLNDNVDTTTPTDIRRKAYLADKGNDRGLDVLFTQFGRYLLISSSRNSLPANLQGLWNNSGNPPWRSDYHSDINVTMNYSSAQDMNLPECFMPFVNFVQNQRDIRHKRTQEKYPGVRGWTLQTETNPFGGNTWNWNNPGSAWYCNLLWDHFLFSRDTAYLRDTALPIMKEVSQFWQDHLVLRNGKLVTPDGWSPENTVGIEAGVSYDQQWIWDVLTNYSKAEGIVNADPVFHRVVDSLLKLLDPGLRIGALGDLQEWQTDKQGELYHRHLSHLVGLFPGFQISPFVDAKYANAAKQALIRRGDGSTGWSSVWRADCWARLLDGNMAYHQMGLQMTKFVFSNLLDNCNNVFQIDGNLGWPSAVSEMLLQSHNGFLHPLAALPDAWPDGQVSGLRARGDYTVGIRWAGKKATSITVHAGKTDTCVIRTTAKSAVYLQGTPYPYKASGDTLVTFLATAGQTCEVDLGNAGISTAAPEGARPVLRLSGREISISGLQPGTYTMTQYGLDGSVVHSSARQWPETSTIHVSGAPGLYAFRLRSGGQEVNQMFFVGN